MAKTRMRHGPIATLDVGTTKVACFVARASDDGLKVLGIGHHWSRGIRNGAVIDMDEAEASIRAAVDAAEQMADERIQSVVVNVSGGQPSSTSVSVEVTINGHEIGDTDIRRMLDLARDHSASDEREQLHAIPVGFTVDGNEGVRDPRGMFGSRLEVTVHQISAAAGPLRNLSTVVHRCHLDIEARVASAYASGLACLVEDEKDLGVTCIDMGGGTTTIGVFEGSHLVHTDTLPLGGMHVTNDIARGLSTPVAQAERLKTLYGSTMSSPSDEREILKVPLVGEDEDGAANQVPRSTLVQIIRPRLEETFEMARGQIEAAGFDRLASRRVVLTGGASQLHGVRELAALVLDKQVRLGRPAGFHGLPEATGGPAFATCAGLLRYAAQNQIEGPSRESFLADAVTGGKLERLGGWLRKNF